MNENPYRGYRPVVGRDPFLDFISALASGRLAAVSLAIAEILSALDCLAIVLLGLFGFIVGCVRGDIVLILSSLIGTPVAFMLQFAVLVVFARVADLESG